MRAYFIRRFLLIIPTFLGITVLVFAITRFVPGGPVERMIAEANMAREGRSDSSAGFGSSVLNEEQIEQLKKYYGFDKPVLVSYFEWLGKVVRLDLGYSLKYGEPVWDSIKSRLPISMYFGFVTMFLTYLICIPLGVWKAIKHKKPFDNISSIFVFVGYAIPSYVAGVMLLVYFCSEIELFPIEGFVSDEFEYLSFFGKVKDILHHTAMPLTAYMIGSFAVMTMLMKNSLMDNLSADYVRTAIAKGASFKQAVIKHALRNSLIPLATHFGNNISALIAGAFLIEKIFNINGFGLLGFEAVVERDYPTVLGILVISSLLQLIGNILSDICVAIVDPRVEFK
jgi:microcin C transport system permease protein